MKSDDIDNIITRYWANVQREHRKYIDDIRKIMRTNNLDEDIKRDYHSRFMKGVLPGHVDHRVNLIKSIRKYDVGASFKTSLSSFVIERKYLESEGIIIFPRANDRNFDRRIFQSAGVRTPNIYGYDVNFSDSLSYDKCVVKPLVGSGSKGVFIKKNDVYTHVLDGITMNADSSARLFKEICRGKTAVIEELLEYESGPARDLKFYSFYGRTPLVMEMDRSTGTARFCFYNEDGKITDPGRGYGPERMFRGTGIEESIYQDAARISLSIPSPFVRIDFLLTDRGVFGGEITPVPGNFHSYDYHWDRKMGICFLEARARLARDFISGRTFNEYFSQIVKRD